MEDMELQGGLKSQTSDCKMINTVMKSILKYWSRDTACHYLGLAAGTPNKITAARSLVLLLQFMIMITPETW